MNHREQSMLSLILILPMVATAFGFYPESKENPKATSKQEALLKDGGQLLADLDEQKKEAEEAVGTIKAISVCQGNITLIKESYEHVRTDYGAAAHAIAVSLKNDRSTTKESAFPSTTGDDVSNFRDWIKSCESKNKSNSNGTEKGELNFAAKQNSTLHDIWVFIWKNRDDIESLAKEIYAKLQKRAAENREVRLKTPKTSGDVELDKLADEIEVAGNWKAFDEIKKVTSN